jgi:beta-ribofuranosylaminobenzene 5'-phosphate synthase
MKVRVRTPSRIHITLIDLNGEIGRVDGGIGVALKEPYIEITAREAEDVVIKSSSTPHFERSALKLRSAFGKGIEINVKSEFKSHVGLGSGTQSSLAVAKAYQVLYNLDLSVKELAGLVGRGGTSGIGVAVFEKGGFVLDGGHSKKLKKDFLPSSASKAPPPPVLARYDFPDWDIVVATPDLTGYYGGEEVNLFQKYCPISISEVRTLSHIILMKVLPSVVEKDLDSFREGIHRIQQLGFKRVEVEQYGDLIKNLIDMMKDETVIGMSSTGPTVYAITDSNTSRIEKEIKNYFKNKGFECVTTRTKAKNAPADVMRV